MRPLRGRLLAAVLAAAALLALAALVAALLQPERLARRLLDAAGRGAGLQIGFEGDVRYRLRGRPLLEVRALDVRRPGDAVPMLRASRALVSLPWSTVRARGAGAPMEIERIELDAPVLDLGRLRGWLASRPPGDGAMPTLRDGLEVDDGRVVGDGWELHGLDLRVPRLASDAPVAASGRGTLALTPPMRLHFDLRLAATRPAIGAGVAVRGPVRLESEGWRLPAFVAASGAPRRVDDGWHVPRLRFGTSGRVRTGGQSLRFAFGAEGPLRRQGGTWTLAPAGFALHGDGALVPTASGRGHAALGDSLAITLHGRMPEWPAAWPALPPPLDAGGAIEVGLRYRGATDFSAPVGLRVALGGAQASASGRLPGLLAWLDAPTAGTPLPPLRAVARVPRVEVAGAVIEGLEVELAPGPVEPR